MLFEIKHRYNESILFSLECKSLKLCVEAAINANANLRFTDLSSANLSSANLRFANLRFADLSFADLSFADLSFADFRFTDLSSADLRSANLRFADLSFADLSFANLWDQKLTITPIQLAYYKYDVLIAGTKIKIGCELHTISEWKKFSRKRIIEMGGKSAWQWWKEHKPLIIPIAEHHKALHLNKIKTEKAA